MGRTQIHKQLDEVMMPRCNNLPIMAYESEDDIRMSSGFHVVGDFQIASERR